MTRNLTEQQIQIVRFIQGDLPVTERPFALLAARLGIGEEQVVGEIDALKRSGVIRRFGMAVRHQNIGYTANGMSCWDVPDDRIELAAKVMAALPQITHCYERPRFPGWPYNLYAMIHGKKRDTVLKIARRISAQTGVGDYRVLFSTREYKRTSMSYFVQED